jgi:hypothetical protein
LRWPVIRTRSGSARTAASTNHPARASNREREGVQLVDSEAAMAAQSPHGLAGEEFLYEHVHLNFEGNYLVARALAEQIGRALSASAEHPWPTADDCARRLGWNDFTRRAGEMDILSRLNDPPFKEQANNRQQYQRLLSKSNSFNPRRFPTLARGKAPHQSRSRRRAR